MFNKIIEGMLVCIFIPNKDFLKFQIVLGKQIGEHVHESCVTSIIGHLKIFYL